MNYHWRITYRAKKSPYVIGFEKRRGAKLPINTSEVTLSGTEINTRPEMLKEFRKSFPFAIIVKSKKEAIK